jgi:hypothetical protein
LNYSPERVQPLNDEYRQRLVKNANLSAPLLNGWTLFPHQKKAILRSLLMRRFILALDMGLGKTVIGCVWAKAFQQTYQELTILVVCPVSLKPEWKRTAEEATGLQVDDDVSMQICSWSKIPSAPTLGNFVVVFDEAHMMQSLQAARTKESLQLVRSQRYVTSAKIWLLLVNLLTPGSICQLRWSLDAYWYSYEEWKASESLSAFESSQSSFWRPPKGI